MSLPASLPAYSSYYAPGAPEKEGRDSVSTHPDDATRRHSTGMTGPTIPLTIPGREVSFRPQTTTGSQQTDGLSAGTSAPTSGIRESIDAENAAQALGRELRRAHSVIPPPSGSPTTGPGDDQQSIGASSGRESTVGSTQMTWEELRSVLAKYKMQEKLDKEYKELQRKLAAIASAKRGEERPPPRDYFNYTYLRALRDTRRTWQESKRLRSQAGAYRKARKRFFREL
jgi:hypothetical protein